MADRVALVFDHLAVSGETLEAARAHVEQALGVSLQPGGRHDVFFTHNALLGMQDGLYLEAIAIDPNAEMPTRPRWFALDQFAGPPRLTNWICRSSDLQATLAGLPHTMGGSVALARGNYRWSMAVPDTGVLPYDNKAPALIQWHAGGHPCDVLTPAPIRLRRLTLRHPDANALKELLGPFLTDDRLAFETGESACEAVFETGHGDRMLTG